MIAKDWVPVFPGFACGKQQESGGCVDVFVWCTFMYGMVLVLLRVGPISGNG